jgi:glycosyltransferase involved in cell wall biosynthesis
MRKIAVLCEVLHPPLDEGVRILAAELAAALSRRCEVLLLGEHDAEVKGMRVRGVLHDRLFAGAPLARALAEGRPDALLYVPWTSLTPRTFLRVGMLRRRLPAAGLGVLALQPRKVDLLSRLALKLGRPDELFAIGPEVVRQADALGLRSLRLEGGVDLDRFQPIGGESPIALRRGLALPASAYLVLHVGHLKPTRGVRVLKSLQALGGIQTVLIASSSTEWDSETRRDLQRAGVRVIDHHVPNVEEYYRAVDCYLFPVTSSLDAIELPLSVLEAMACDLPIVTTRFGGIPALMEGVDRGVIFVASEEEIPRAVLALRKDRPRPDLRSRLRQLTWDAMAARIAESLEASIESHGRRSPEGRG